MTMPEPVSPLAFARDYQVYHAEAAQTSFADTRLLLAARFWTGHGDALGDPLYETFWREDLPPVLHTVAGVPLDDLIPDELEEVAAFVGRVAGLFSDVAADARPIWEKAAEGWLYVGEAERALAVLASTDEIASSLVPPEAGLAPRNDIMGQAGMECHCEESRPSGRDDAAISSLETADAEAIPSLLADQLERSRPEMARWLRDFGARWQAKRESGDPRRAHCLFVEYDTRGLPVRGRLRTLEGKIDRLAGDADADEVIFHHQVASPDDPFVGSAYGALSALRQVTSRRRILGSMEMAGDSSRAESREARPTKNANHVGRAVPADHGSKDPWHTAANGARHVGRASLDSARDKPPAVHGPHYRARFTLSGQGDEIYTGESIGLAAFAVAYGDSWAGEIHRERRLIGETVAFTGGMNAAGAIQPVSSESLALKVQRAFFSPIDNLVVPEANRREAETAVEQLRRLHPLRRLRVIGIERPADIVADHNILRPEKVCFGEFAVRKAARYSRSVKVQVPVLIVLGYLLACLIHPPLWLFFDSNPVRIEVTPRGIKALNRDAQTIGGFFRLPGVLYEAAYKQPRGEDEVVFSLLADLNGDGKNEIVFCPYYMPGTTRSSQGPVYVFGSKRFGGLDSLFTLPLSVPTRYENDAPSDSGSSYPYFLTKLMVLDRAAVHGPEIAIISANSEPSRGHADVYDAGGHLRGTYLNQGQFCASSCALLDVDSDGREELCLGGDNRRLGAAALAILDPSFIDGASPPWDHPYFLNSGMPKGSQEWYFTFPKSKLSEKSTLMNTVRRQHLDSNRGLLVQVREAPDVSDVGILYQLARDLMPTRVTLPDGTAEAWRQRFGETVPLHLEDSLLAHVRVWRDTSQVYPPVQ